MTGFFLHICIRIVAEFLLFELLVIVHHGSFADEGEELGFDLIGSFAFGLNRGNVITIIVGENHFISVDAQTLSHRDVLLLFFHHFLILFANRSHLILTKLVISRMIRPLIVSFDWGIRVSIFEVGFLIH